MAVLNLPEEIELDILSRLPVKSLLQFGCVSKPARSFISHPHFIKLHLNRSVHSKNSQKIFWYDSNFTPQSIDYESLLESNNNNNENINVDNNAVVELNCPLWSCQGGHTAYVFGSCNGLICYVVGAFKFILYNPSTRVSKELPEPPITSPLSWIDCHYGFAFDFFDDDYKVVLGTNISNSRENIRFHVFSRRHNSWRRIQDLSCGHLGTLMYGHGIFVNGALHWLLIPAASGSGQGHWVLVSLDLSKEVFSEMSLDNVQNKTDLNFYVVGAFEECLCLYGVKASRKSVEVWLMKEYGVKASWSKFITIPIDMGYYIGVKPLCFLRNGEVLLKIYRKSDCLNQTSLASYSTIENSLTKICNCPYFLEAHLYVESLVPPSSFD